MGPQPERDICGWAVMGPLHALPVWLILALIVGGVAGRTLPIRLVLIASMAVVLFLALYCGRHYIPSSDPEYDGNANFQLYVGLICLPLFISWFVGACIGYWLRRRTR